MTTVLHRLKMELNHKNYYNNEEFEVYLNENDLYSEDEYIKDDHYRGLLATVLAIFQSLANNVQYYMKFETEYGSQSQAYSNLKLRIDDIKKRIKEIDDESSDNSNQFSYMFYTNRRRT